MMAIYFECNLCGAISDAICEDTNVWSPINKRWVEVRGFTENEKEDKNYDQMEYGNDADTIGHLCEKCFPMEKRTYWSPLPDNK